MSIREILEKIKGGSCCSSCIEDKHEGFGDDIEGCCCRHITSNQALSAIHSELKGLVEDKEMPSHYDLCVLSNEDRIEEESKIEGFNQANALWRTKLAEKFEVK